MKSEMRWRVEGKRREAVTEKKRTNEIRRGETLEKERNEQRCLS